MQITSDDGGSSAGVDGSWWLTAAKENLLVVCGSFGQAHSGSRIYSLQCIVFSSQTPFSTKHNTHTHARARARNLTTMNKQWAADESLFIAKL